MTKSSNPKSQELVSAYEKLGQARWDTIRLLKGTISELTNDNDLEDTVVFLCHEIVKRDKPFQKLQAQLRKLDLLCTCDGHDDEEEN
tara:strand:- start:237 stop:497 length:261 start_codon:yes stop_codon:yes gene_type:complete